IDNQMRRSFATADVNTVIVLFGAAQDTSGRVQTNLDSVVRFVMVTTPFEVVLTGETWKTIETIEERTTAGEYRVFPATQNDLLTFGSDEQQHFEGDKWGGRYLRAPDIYWVILERSREKLVTIGDVADVRRGFTTGGNEFFYLDHKTAL